MQGNVIPIVSPVEPEFGGGDGDGPDLVECPECTCTAFELEWYDDGEIAAICMGCGSEMALTIKPDEDM